MPGKPSQPERPFLDAAIVIDGAYTSTKRHHALISHHGANGSADPLPEEAVLRVSEATEVGLHEEKRSGWLPAARPICCVAIESAWPENLHGTSGKLDLV